MLFIPDICCLRHLDAAKVRKKTITAKKNTVFLTKGRDSLTNFVVTFMYLFVSKHYTE